MFLGKQKLAERPCELRRGSTGKNFVWTSEKYIATEDFNPGEQWVGSQKNRQAMLFWVLAFWGHLLGWEQVLYSSKKHEEGSQEMYLNLV